MAGSSSSTNAGPPEPEFHRLHDFYELIIGENEIQYKNWSVYNILLPVQREYPVIVDKLSAGPWGFDDPEIAQAHEAMMAKKEDTKESVNKQEPREELSLLAGNHVSLDSNGKVGLRVYVASNKASHNPLHPGIGLKDIALAFFIKRGLKIENLAYFQLDIIVNERLVKALKNLCVRLKGRPMIIDSLAGEKRMVLKTDGSVKYLDKEDIPKIEDENEKRKKVFSMIEAADPVRWANRIFEKYKVTFKDKTISRFTVRGDEVLTMWIE